MNLPDLTGLRIATARGRGALTGDRSPWPRSWFARGCHPGPEKTPGPGGSRWIRRAGPAAIQALADHRAEAEYIASPYVCPGCYAVASRCATGCPEGDREEQELYRESRDEDWGDWSASGEGIEP